MVHLNTNFFILPFFHIKKKKRNSVLHVTNSKSKVEFTWIPQHPFLSNQSKPRGSAQHQPHPLVFYGHTPWNSGNVNRCIEKNNKIKEKKQQREKQRPDQAQIVKQWKLTSTALSTRVE